MFLKSRLSPSVLLFVIVSTLLLACSKDKDPINLPVLSDKNEINSFVITKGAYTKNFDVIDNSIAGTVDSEIELKDLVLNVSISKGATISPDPSKISSISGDFNFTVTAENGQSKIYKVSIKRILSDKNSILSLDINTSYFSTNAQIDEDNKLITQRIPEFIDISNLSTVLRVSDRATISPNPNDVRDYSGSVKFTVTSESGIKKDYTVTISKMSNSFSESCKTMNASKWFGGDDRTNVPDIIPYDRNIGTGQAILFNKDTNPLTFNVFFSGGFQYYRSDYFGNLELKLNIRDTSGKIIGTTNKIIQGTSFNGGSISFDLTKLKLFFKKDIVYIFQWYLVNGESLGVFTGSTGNTNSGEGFCFSGGLSSESNLISRQSNQEDMKIWGKHPWNFNFEIMGKE